MPRIPPPSRQSIALDVIGIFILSNASLRAALIFSPLDFAIKVKGNLQLHIEVRSKK
jgi:hypothetical protein